MASLFKRIIRVDIADLVIEEPRIRFSLARESDETAPSGEITIWNLARPTEDRIFERGASVKLDAGYPSTIATLFDGHVEKIVRERAELARLTRITLTGQATNAGQRSDKISIIHPTATPISLRELAAYFVRDLGLTLGPQDAIDASLTVQNWTWAGPTIPGLNVICRRANVTWYEDDGVVRFNRIGELQSDAVTITLTPDSGLIGSPAVTEEGVRCRSFLQPLARVGAQVDVRSENVDGSYKLVSLVHRGDNWDGEFVTEYDLREPMAAPATAPADVGVPG